MGPGSTGNTATVEQREGGQETRGYAQRSFATRSNYEQYRNWIGIAVDALLDQTKTKLQIWRLRLS